MRVSVEGMCRIGLVLCSFVLVASGCGEEEEGSSAAIAVASPSGESGGGSAGADNEPKKVLSPEAQVEDTLKRWCSAQVRGGFKVYSAFYASNFEGIRRTAKRKAKKFDRSGWMDDRRSTFDSPVKVDCLNPKISLSSDKKRAEVVFEQYWRSSTYADQGDKKVILENQSGKWLLISEDMLNSKKWKRKNFRDGSPATAGPAKVKVGRLRLKSLRALTGDANKPMSGLPGSGMDFVKRYCNARSPVKLSGFQFKAIAPKDAVVAAYRYKVRGSTSTYEDDEGYMACNEKKHRPIGKGEVSADGDVVKIALDGPMKTWPCHYKIAVTAVDAQGVPLAKGRTKGGIGCPE